MFDPVQFHVSEAIGILAKPLPEPISELFPAAVQGNLDRSTERLKYPLPENSEPLTYFHASEKGVLK